MVANDLHIGAEGLTRTCAYRHEALEHLPFRKCKQAGTRSGDESCERSQQAPFGHSPFCRYVGQIVTFSGSWMKGHKGPLEHRPRERFVLVSATHNEWCYS